MIRKFQPSDSEQVMRLWLAGNEDAHPFIPEEYWRSHFSQVKQQLSQAEIYVYCADGNIQGFIGIINEYIAGIFVDKSCRGRGIGKRLLKCAKEKRSSLSLGVYQKNTRAAAFYLREGFTVHSKAIDEETGENEYEMVWNRPI